MGRTTILNCLLFLALLLVGCGGRASIAPTPFPTVGPTLTPGATGPVELTVTELMSAPGLYLDVPIRLSGQLRKQPLVVCDSDLHPSPATWALAEEGVLALAGGFDQQVRSLLPDELAMTVEGRWRRWEGLVGCGKLAQQREVWYLEAGRILNPTPLTQVTLTPSSGVEIVEVTTEATPTLETIFEGDLEETPPPEDELFSPEPDEESGGLPSPTDDFFGEQTLQPTLPVTLTRSAITTPLATPGNGQTGTPSGVTTTPDSQLTGTPEGTPTPTPSGTPPTPTATTTTGGTGQVVSRGNLYDLMAAEFITATLGGGTIDSWELDIFEEEQLYVSVIAPAPADIIISILKDGQPIVNRQNTAAVGTTEFINNPSLQGEGIYEIQVSTVGSVSTDYALGFYTDPENGMIIFPGIISSGNPRSAVQMQANSFHYWFFVGQAGREVTILLTPLGQEDPAVYLYAPDGEELLMADDGFEGEEEILEFTLTSGGLHAISIEELYGEDLNYNLELTIQ